MNKTFDVKFNENDLKTIKDLIKEKGIRHFKLECDLYGVLDVVLYEEYQKLEKEKDKEIERLSKEVDMWNRKYNEQFERAERLNNIINELERWMKDSEIEVIGDSETFSLTYNDALNKLKKLKEGKE